MHLVEETVTTIDNYTSITRGREFRNKEIYIPAAIPQGYMLPTWAYIPKTPKYETIFDGNATRFIEPANQWRSSEDLDKYLVFPKTNILG